MSRPRRTFALWLSLSAASGCRACGDAPDRGGAATASSAAPRPPARAPSLPTFAPIRGTTGFALPSGCVERAPTQRASVAEGSTLLADAATLGAVALSSPSNAGERAVAVLGLESDGARVSAELPRASDDEAWRLARAGSRWLAALSEQGEGERAILLWRGLGVAPIPAPEAVGRGDGLVTTALACGESRCVLLTPRPSRVAAPGAAVWLGDGAEPFGRWRSWTIEAGEPPKRPRAVAAVDPVPVIVVREGDDAVALALDPAAPDSAAPREVGRVTAAAEIVGAALAPDLVVLSSPAEAAAEGDCRPNLPLRIARAGAAIELRAAATPSATALRPLGRGVLALWLSPLGCGADRRVLSGVVADPKPAAADPPGRVGEPMAVGDAEAFAVASRGSEVDLWAVRGASLTWIRMRCAAP